MSALLLSAAQLRLGVERLVKLELERRVLPELGRVQLEGPKERQRVDSALQALSAPLPLSERRAGQVQRATADAAELIEDLGRPGATLLSDSEALAVRLGFVTTTLSAAAADPQRGALVDLLARAGATALRVGKLNFAAAAAGHGVGVAVAARQSLTEFQSALQAIGTQELSGAARAELALAQNQWLLFRSTLKDDGLVKSRERLPELATTTDRIAEALQGLARRVLSA